MYEEELRNEYLENSKHWNIHNDIIEPVTEEKKKKILKVINESYLKFDSRFQAYVGYYYRTIYYMFKIVDRNLFLTKKEKYFYTHILRAHLSAYELLLFFYNCLSDRGNEKVMPLIKKYQLLKHIEIIKNKLIDIKNVDHTYLYAPTAFRK